jgi:hypothetical protein
MRLKQEAIREMDAMKAQRLSLRAIKSATWARRPL